MCGEIRVRITFDGVDVDQYLSDYDDRIQKDEETQRELERIATQSSHHLLPTSVHEQR